MICLLFPSYAPTHLTALTSRPGESERGGGQTSSRLAEGDSTYICLWTMWK